jgi:Alpha-L-fucosidase
MRQDLGKRGKAATLAVASLLAILLPVGGWPQQTANNDIGDGGNSMAFDMAPETNLAVVNAAMKQIPIQMAPGPVQPTWKSLKQSYRVPDWFIGAKFGIFMHFGIFSVPAHKNEWYEKFMYAGGEDSTLKAMGSHDSLLGIRRISALRTSPDIRTSSPCSRQKNSTPMPGRHYSSEPAHVM